MQILTYDATFAGFLTCVFTVYARKLGSVSILKDAVYVPDMLSEQQYINTDNVLAERVLTGLVGVLGESGVGSLMRAYLCEDDSIENTLLGTVRHALAKEKQVAGTGQWALSDYTHPDVMVLTQWLKKIAREQHRMTAFVRFELLDVSEMGTGKLYFARVEPDYNVLPLIQSHFKNRYADQNWAIYDVRRGYGICYQVATKQVEMMYDADSVVLKNPASQFSKEEKSYQALWQGFFKHVNIAERKNDKLHRQYVPKRYWQYLTEKQSSGT